MRVLTSKHEPDQQAGTAAAVEHPERIILTLSFSILGIALVYFGTLYLIAH